ncbi:MAG: twin-arginine translocation signal domain-containing protein [Vicinamibacteraceae bacterium]
MKHGIITRRHFLGAGAATTALGVAGVRAAAPQKQDAPGAPASFQAAEKVVQQYFPEARSPVGHPIVRRPADSEPIPLIRDTPLEATPAPTHGAYAEAMIPDTCDLEERARLFVEKYLVRTTVADLHYEPFDWGFFDQVPARLTLGWGDYVCAWPKFRESLPLLRLMIGGGESAEIDRAWHDHLMRSIGPDGLFYIPAAGRPWDTFKAYPWLEKWLASYPGVRHYTYLPTVNGRLLGAVTAQYRLTGDARWSAIARGIVDRMNDLAIRSGTLTSFPRFLFTPGEKPSRDEVRRATARMMQQSGQETERNIALWHTWIVTGLSQYYAASGYEPARDLAYGLVNYMRAARYVEEWKSHFHCITLAIQAMLELAQATNDTELAEYAHRAYLVARSGSRSIALPEIGYFVNGTGRDPMEGCSIGDMTTIAVKLAQLGLQDWEDADRYIRNALVESQRTHADQVRDYWRDLLRAGKASPEQVAYSHLVEQLPERLVGSWSLHFLPNELFGSPHYVTCCSGNCSRALYYAWESILSHDAESGALTINLLLNRTSAWADVQSYIPYTGRVDVRVKKPCKELKVRMSDWIEKGRVGCAVDGRPSPFGWEGRHAVLGPVAPGAVVSFEFPIHERRARLESFGHEYEATFRGNDCVELSPGGEHVPLFQRAYYRTGRPRFIKARRFASDRVLRW